MIKNQESKSPGSCTVTRRIGNTKYKVRISFNNQGNETLEDKVLRMIQNEMEFTSNDRNTGFQNGLSCGTMSLPQMSRPA